MESCQISCVETVGLMATRYLIKYQSLKGNNFKWKNHNQYDDSKTLVQDHVQPFRTE